MLWVQSPAGLKPVKVKIGLVSSGDAELAPGALKEGDEVVNGTALEEAVVRKPNGASGGSPFMPKMPQRKPRNLNPGRTQGGAR